MPLRVDSRLPTMPTRVAGWVAAYSLATPSCRIKFVRLWSTPLDEIEGRFLGKMDNLLLKIVRKNRKVLNRYAPLYFYIHP